MSRLILLRHAKTDWAKPGMRDYDRPLNVIGRRHARDIGREMFKGGVRPDRVICSNARRALETWDGVRESIAAANIDVEFTDMLYGSDAPDYLRVINEAPDCDNLMLIGHNPMMEDIAFALAGNGDSAATAKLEKGFPTCGLAIISFKTALAEARPGKGRLEFFLTPSDVED